MTPEMVQVVLRTSRVVVVPAAPVNVHGPLKVTVAARPKPLQAGVNVQRSTAAKDQVRHAEPGIVGQTVAIEYARKVDCAVDSNRSGAEVRRTGRKDGGVGGGPNHRGRGQDRSGG